MKKKASPPEFNPFPLGQYTMPVRHQEDAALVLDRQSSPPPPLYKVLLINDDFTPMDFVIEVLRRFFNLTLEQATVVMLKVHNEGVGVAGIYPRDIAEAKVSQVSAHARAHQHPLQCTMEESR